MRLKPPPLPSERGRRGRTGLGNGPYGLGGVPYRVADYSFFCPVKEPVLIAYSNGIGAAGRTCGSLGPPARPRQYWRRRPKNPASRPLSIIGDPIPRLGLACHDSGQPL